MNFHHNILFSIQCLNILSPNVGKAGKLICNPKLPTDCILESGLGLESVFAGRGLGLELKRL